LGDLILGTGTIHRWQVDRMFVVAGTLGIGSLAFACLATWGSTPPKPVAHPPLALLLYRHTPVMVLMVGVGMGIGLTMPSVFLAAYAAKLNIAHIGLFFGVYAPAAIATRVVTRRMPEHFGTTPMILIGTAGLVVSPLLLLLVDARWTLVLPGVSYGVSHALLFPSIIAAGTRPFPEQHRGLATTLIMGTWDAGALVGSPLAGAILHYSALAGLPPYPCMFVAMSGLLAILGTTFAVAQYRRGWTETPPPCLEPPQGHVPADASVAPAPLEMG
jgi:hypothetical protein